MLLAILAVAALAFVTPLLTVTHLGLIVTTRPPYIPVRLAAVSLSLSLAALIYLWWHDTSPSTIGRPMGTTTEPFWWIHIACLWGCQIVMQVVRNRAASVGALVVLLASSSLSILAATILPQGS